MIARIKRQFPEGTPVIVKQGARTGRGVFLSSETVGTVIEWKFEATGAWFAENGDPETLNGDGKLLLLRLSMRKVDGEITKIVIDDLTSIAMLEATATETKSTTGARFAL